MHMGDRLGRLALVHGRLGRSPFGLTGKEGVDEALTRQALAVERLVLCHGILQSTRR